MIVTVVIEPGEHYEAMEAYGDWLTPEQRAQIAAAPDTALIVLSRSNGVTKVTVIEEG